MFRRSKRRTITLLIGALSVAMVGFGFWLFAGLPNPANLSHRASLESTKILDRNGVVLYETPGPDEGKRTRVSLSEFPTYLIKATIATEDAGFYTNPGVDAIGIARALAANIRGGEVVAGGSTITQQVVRTALLSQDEKDERSLRRKIREAVLALAITKLYSKDTILETYLNEVYYGNMAYGMEAAAQAYFGKHARDLDLAEATLLVGLTQSPASYNPLVNPDGARERQRIVLSLMVANGFITGGEAETAKGEELKFAPAPFDIKAPHFVSFIDDILDREHDELVGKKQGLRVVTTLDSSLQTTAEEVIRNQLARLKDDDVTSASLVALDPHTGQILAMVGSADYFNREIDGAVNIALSMRQPGSAIKPITYAAAFSRGWSPGTVVADVRTAFPTREGLPFVPSNYDYAFHGPVSLRQALGSSINVPAVKVLEYVGLPEFIDFAHDLDIPSLVDDSRYGLSLTLGGGEVSLLELTSAYGILANEGNKKPLQSILRIEDNNGKVLYQNAPAGNQPVLDPRVAYLVTDVLADDSARRLTFGGYSPLRLSRPAAVKTGTTTAYRDNWTIGYTPDLVVGVWAGNANGSPMKNVSGVSGAAPIWHDFMEEAGKVSLAQSFVEPPGLVHVDICPDSGQLPGPYCPYRKQEVYLAGSEPKEVCSIHQMARVCLVENRLATPYCPPDEVVEKVFAVYPPELALWAQENGIPEPPSGYCTVHGTGATLLPLEQPTIKIMSPDEGSVFALDPSLPVSQQRLEISAISSAGPSSVRLTIDGRDMAVFDSAPYSWRWQIEEGEHTLAAIALNDAGKELARSEARISVVRQQG